MQTDTVVRDTVAAALGRTLRTNRETDQAAPIELEPGRLWLVPFHTQTVACEAGATLLGEIARSKLIAKVEVEPYHDRRVDGPSWRLIVEAR